jgi:hypothetical protein
MKKLRILFVAALVAMALSVPQVAWAAPGTNNCWGKVTSQRASTLHDVGEHAAAQEEPRLGLGNLAHDGIIPGVDTVGELGSVLGSIDDIEATHCP